MSGVCGGSCPGGNLCSFSGTSLDCGCPTSSQCQAGTCVAAESCAGCPSCPVGYACTAHFQPSCPGSLIYSCVGPSCGSDCSCPVGGSCRVP
jgi:hypothetical protein